MAIPISGKAGVSNWGTGTSLIIPEAIWINVDRQERFYASLDEPDLLV
jgi:hypothetical protein